MTPECVEEFCENGYVVIDDVLSEEQVVRARQLFHDDLKVIGIDHQAILHGQKNPPQECAIKSPVSDFFYMRWKLLDIHLNPQVVDTMHDLLKSTFLSQRKGFETPIELSSQRIFCLHRPSVLPPSQPHSQRKRSRVASGSSSNRCDMSQSKKVATDSSICHADRSLGWIHGWFASRAQISPPDRLFSFRHQIISRRVFSNG